MQYIDEPALQEGFPTEVSGVRKTDQKVAIPHRPTLLIELRSIPLVGQFVRSLEFIPHLT